MAETDAGSKSKTEPFRCTAGDPLAAEHEAVSNWVETAIASEMKLRAYGGVDLKALPSGRKLLEASHDEAATLVRAAAVQAMHWAELRSGLSLVENYALCHDAEVREQYAGRVINALIRRKLPLAREDLILILRWFSERQAYYRNPVGPVVKALQRYAAGSSLDEESCDAVQNLVAELRRRGTSDCQRHLPQLEQLGREVQPKMEESSGPRQPPPEPAAAGSPLVLDQIKRHLGMTPGDVPPTIPIGVDQFPMREDSPLRAEHEALAPLVEEAQEIHDMMAMDAQKLKAWPKLQKLDSEGASRLLFAAAERHVHAASTSRADFWQTPWVCSDVVEHVLKGQYRLTREGLFDLLLYLTEAHYSLEDHVAGAKMLLQAENLAAEAPLSEGERFVLSRVRLSRVAQPLMGSSTEDIMRLTRMIGDGAVFYLVPGEVWSDALNRDLSEQPTDKQQQWQALLEHLVTAKTARPSAKWSKTAAQLVEAVGAEAVRAMLGRWLPLVAKGRTKDVPGAHFIDRGEKGDVMEETNALCLRGMLWVIPSLPGGEELLRTITAVALSAYKKVPGIGPRAVKVGNAAVYALSSFGSEEAVGQLAMLKVRIKFGTAQKEIDKAFNAAAEALGLPREDIEEMGVPSYGLEAVGRREETFGDYRAELIVDGSDADVRWFAPQGKALKSVPAKVKSEHKEEWKELQQALKDIRSMLPAQRDRIDSLFLAQKTWPIGVWRERYLEHPLVGTIARRLLWTVDGTAALFVDGTATDVTGQPVDHGQTAEVALWHPIGREVEEITAWRQRLAELEITQPFKQAHREVYLLTDAERNTRTYSNRFAAHVLRQHQFNALCAARGWRNKLRMMVDDEYPPPARELTEWGLRAEFWVEGIGTEYGLDTNDSGAFLRIATDQVRFYRLESAENWAHAGGGGYRTNAAGPGNDNVNEPLPLEEIPILVFSEIMRDVDLFVGVASVGNDPTWQDGGPQGRYLDYWQRYSFGELSGTSQTRREVLEQLVPRLKIADRCSFSDRFLVVQGQKRTYKIHLGSGNILMEPNDQYLCIVPDGRASTKRNDLFLPFEGDRTLSVILSKALLLADDDKIKDPTILSQINRP